MWNEGNDNFYKNNFASSEALTVKLANQTWSYIFTEILSFICHTSCRIHYLTASEVLQIMCHKYANLYVQCQPEVWAHSVFQTKF